MTIGKGNDQIDVYYFGTGHTNGDAIIVFPKLKIAHTGDLFATKGLPFVDGNNGGSVLHYPETLMKLHKGIKNVDAIINGHTPKNTSWDDLKMFAECNQDFLTWAQAALKSGKPPKDAAAEWKMPEKYVAAGYPTEPPTSSGGIEGRLTLLQTETAKK
jgi:cyclase